MNGRMARWVGGLLAALVLSVPGVALAQYGIFVPDPGAPAALSVTNSSSRVLLGGSGATTVITDTGSVNVRCRFGDSTVVATTADSVITAGMARAYGTAGTYLACITASGTSTVVAETGSGVAAFGGGGGSGGGGGAVTVAAGADAIEGAAADTSATNTVFGLLQAIKTAVTDVVTESPVKIADGSDIALGLTTASACATDNGNCALLALVKRLNQRLSTLDTDLGTLHTDMGTAIPAGTALIGHTDGPTAALSSTSGNPNKAGCVYQTNTTAAITGQNQNVACGDPYGNTGKSFTPAMATQITAQSATTANTGNTATLAAAASKFTYISGFTCTSGGATAASLVTVTVAGLITGSMTYTVAIPAGVTLAAAPLNVSFPNPIQGSAVNTAITVAIGAAGSGNTVEQCNATGFQQ